MAADDLIQRTALISVLVAIASSIISNFVLGILTTNGLTNRLDILILIIVVWCLFFLGFTLVVNMISICESKRPLFVNYLRRVGYITNFVLGVVVSLYITSFLSQISFQAFSTTEAAIIVIGAILFIAALYLVLEQFASVSDPRFEGVATTYVATQKTN